MHRTDTPWGKGCGGEPKEAPKRSLSRDPTAFGNLSLRRWHCIKEPRRQLLSRLLTARILPLRQVCPALGASVSLSLLAAPSQIPEGHRTSTFPPKHTQTSSPGGSRAMIQQGREEKSSS